MGALSVDSPEFQNWVETCPPSLRTMVQAHPPGWYYLAGRLVVLVAYEEQGGQPTGIGTVYVPPDPDRLHALLLAPQGHEMHTLLTLLEPAELDDVPLHARKSLELYLED